MLYKEFMQAGYRIFPLYGIDRNGNCECGDKECEGAGKHPRMPNWQNTIIWDDEQIENMEEAGWLSTGYGVLCRGLLVIDVDARNGGVESFCKFTKQYPSANLSKLEVITGSGGGSKHVYFSLPEPIPMVQSLPEYPGLDFKTSGYVVGPGSIHKSGDRYANDGYVEEIGEAPHDIIDALRRPEYHRYDYNGVNIDISHRDISDMLSHVSNSDLDYEIWIIIGMAIHHATQGTGYALWDEWSSTSGKHNPKAMDAKWHSFGRAVNPATVGTLIWHAEQGGWQMPVSFVSDQEFTDETPATLLSGLPFSIDGIDLTQPPGFVGEVAAWIESQSRRPRRHLAVAGALVSIGNIAGLRYTDDKDGVTTNLFCFCIAGSRTGKESIMQGVMSMHKAAGIIAASHGSIKSEQEVTRNLTRHQAALYVVDEIGILLQKIRNAQQRGGAAYLDGVIGILMSAYSKANGHMLLTGDAKEAVRQDMLKEASQIEKRMDTAGETPSLKARLDNLKIALSSIDRGLDRPFLSLIGFTTPVTFDETVDYESATNGFVGRSLLFNERDTAPRSKKNFKKPPMASHVEALAKQIYGGTEYDMMAVSRVENYAERVAIPTESRAEFMLDSALEWFEDRAADERAGSGLESLYLGGYELVSKVSLILAVTDGLRTTEHVRWAFALIKRDVEEKIRLVVGNDREKDAPKMALQAKVANLIADDGETFGVICGRLRRKRKEDIQDALDKMVEKGLAEVVISNHPRNGSEILRYRLTK